MARDSESSAQWLLRGNSHMDVPRAYDAIVLAGTAPATTPSSSGMGAGNKALLDIEGRPMLSYVVDALMASGRVRRLILAGLTDVDSLGLSLACPLACLPDRHSMIGNLLSAIEAIQAAEPILICSCDLPLLSGDAVDDFIRRSEESGAELCYPVVPRETMEARFPGSGRTFVRLAEGHFAGGDLSLLSPDLVRRNADFGRSLSENHKSPVRLARILGLRSNADTTS